MQQQGEVDGMKKRRMVKMAGAAVCIGLLVCAGLLLPGLRTGTERVPGLNAEERVLLRVWVVDAPGGGQAWLKGQLRQFERKHPGVATYLRSVTADALTEPGAILPDLVLYMPGDLSSPEILFLPLSGQMTAREDGLIREELLRCGRWRGAQYGLPLCWSAWVLAIDSALEPGSAATPAPTTLLGKPAATSAAGATPEPPYPLSAAAQTACALQSPGGAALFTLGLLLAERPPVPDSFGTLTSAEVYAAFRKRQCATAMLTTGQATAFSSLTSAGSGFPFRIMTAEEVITDQVWLASVTADSPRETAMLLSWLTSSDAQKALSAQGLHTVRSDLSLYAAGMSAQVEQAGRRSLSAISAYADRQAVHSAAWQYFQGRMNLSEAMLPLL